MYKQTEYATQLHVRFTVYKCQKILQIKRNRTTYLPLALFRASISFFFTSCLIDKINTKFIPNDNKKNPILLFVAQSTWGADDNGGLFQYNEATFHDFRIEINSPEKEKIKSLICHC